MKTKFKTLFQSIILLFSLFTFLNFGAGKVMGQEEICGGESSLDATAIEQGDNIVVKVSGCSTIAETYIRIFPRQQEDEKALENQFLAEAGEFGPLTFTIDAAYFEDDDFVSIGLGYEGIDDFEWIINPAVNSGIAIQGRAIVTDPDNKNVNLITSFTNGADSATEISTVFDTPAKLVNLIITNLFTIAGIVLFFNMLIAASKFVTQTAKGKEEAKNIMTISVVGFIIMFTAYWIVQIVGIITGTDIII